MVLKVAAETTPGSVGDGFTVGTRRPRDARDVAAAPETRIRMILINPGARQVHPLDPQNMRPRHPKRAARIVSRNTVVRHFYYLLIARN